MDNTDPNFIKNAKNFKDWNTNIESAITDLNNFIGIKDEIKNRIANFGYNKITNIRNPDIIADPERVSDDLNFFTMINRKIKRLIPNIPNLVNKELIYTTIRLSDNKNTQNLFIKFAKNIKYLSGLIRLVNQDIINTYKPPLSDDQRKIKSEINKSNKDFDDYYKYVRDIGRTKYGLNLDVETTQNFTIDVNDDDNPEQVPVNLKEDKKQDETDIYAIDSKTPVSELMTLTPGRNIPLPPIGVNKATNEKIPSGNEGKEVVPVPSGNEGKEVVPVPSGNEGKEVVPVPSGNEGKEAAPPSVAEKNESVATTAQKDNVVASPMVTGKEVAREDNGVEGPTYKDMKSVDTQEAVLGNTRLSTDQPVGTDQTEPVSPSNNNNMSWRVAVPTSQEIADKNKAQRIQDIISNRKVPKRTYVPGSEDRQGQYANDPTKICPKPIVPERDIPCKLDDSTKFNTVAEYDEYMKYDKYYGHEEQLYVKNIIKFLRNKNNKKETILKGIENISNDYKNKGIIDDQTSNSIQQIIQENIDSLDSDFPVIIKKIRQVIPQPKLPEELEPIDDDTNLTDIQVQFDKSIDNIDILNLFDNVESQLLKTSPDIIIQPAIPISPLPPVPDTAIAGIADINILDLLNKVNRELMKAGPDKMPIIQEGPVAAINSVYPATTSGTTDFDLSNIWKLLDILNGKLKTIPGEFPVSIPTQTSKELTDVLNRVKPGTIPEKIVSSSPTTEVIPISASDIKDLLSIIGTQLPIIKKETIATDTTLLSHIQTILNTLNDKLSSVVSETNVPSPSAVIKPEDMLGILDRVNEELLKSKLKPSSPTDIPGLYTSVATAYNIVIPYITRPNLENIKKLLKDLIDQGDVAIKGLTPDIKRILAFKSPNPKDIFNTLTRVFEAKQKSETKPSELFNKQIYDLFKRIKLPKQELTPAAPGLAAPGLAPVAAPGPAVSKGTIVIPPIKQIEPNTIILDVIKYKQLTDPNYGTDKIPNMRDNVMIRAIKPPNSMIKSIRDVDEMFALLKLKSIDENIKKTNDAGNDDGRYKEETPFEIKYNQ